MVELNQLYFDFCFLIVKISKIISYLGLIKILGKIILLFSSLMFGELS